MGKTGRDVRWNSLVLDHDFSTEASRRRRTVSRRPRFREIPSSSPGCCRKSPSFQEDDVGFLAYFLASRTSLPHHPSSFLAHPSPFTDLLTSFLLLGLNSSVRSDPTLTPTLSRFLRLRVGCTRGRYTPKSFWMLSAVRPSVPGSQGSFRYGSERPSVKTGKHEPTGNEKLPGPLVGDGRPGGEGGVCRRDVPPGCGSRHRPSRPHSRPRRRPRTVTGSVVGRVDHWGRWDQRGLGPESKGTSSDD